MGNYRSEYLILSYLVLIGPLIIAVEYYLSFSTILLPQRPSNIAVTLLVPTLSTLSISTLLALVYSVRKWVESNIARFILAAAPFMTGVVVPLILNSNVPNVATYSVSGVFWFVITGYVVVLSLTAVAYRGED